MTTAVIGATGRVGSEIVRGVLARGDAVAALVRDPGKARRAFGEPGGLHIRATRLDDPRDLTETLDGIRTLFIAMGSIGIEGVLQRIAINAVAGISSIEQVTGLSVLNTSAGSLGINQRAHYNIDQFASSTAVPYSTIRPAIFSASLLAAAHEVRASPTWTGLAGSGRMALIDHRDAAEAGLRVGRCVHGIETFNVLRGGEYFFLPSLSALRWLGRSTDTCRPISFATRLR
jgi:NAD(P)H dehydrogenase (quinone)